MNRVKSFDATGVAPSGRLYAGDLNGIQDAAAALMDLTQIHGVGTLEIGEVGLQVVRFGALEARLTGAFRIDGILRGLGGLLAGAFTTTARDAIALGSRPYGLVILNTTTNRYEYNSGTDAVPVWLPVGPVAAAVNTYILAGTLAARPGAGTVVAGTLYFATDNGLNYRSDGAATWTMVSSSPLGTDGIGTLAARPAANAVSPGYIYFATDNGLAYRSDGAAWALVSAAAGAELDYQQITASATGSATTEGASTNAITGNSVTYDGTKVKIEFWASAISNGGSGGIAANLVVYRDGTVIANIPGPSGGNPIAAPFKIEEFDTPSAGAHTYKVFAYTTGGAGTWTVSAGAGGAGTRPPAWLRITKA